MTGDCHVQLCVQERWTHSAGAKSCRGKNQKPCSLDSKVEGNQDFEAYRQRHRKDGGESPVDLTRFSGHITVTQRGVQNVEERQ